MLAWFRRHAKVLMVVLGSAAMAIFGLGPVFDELANRSRQKNDPQAEVIATWKGGDITRTSLDTMTRRHFQAQKFLATLYETALEKKGDSFTPAVFPIEPLQDGQRDSLDGQLIYRFLMAERAKMEGVVVSDAMVDDYLASYSGDAGFSRKDLEAIYNEANSSYGSLSAVREHLKLELLSSMMQNYSSVGVPGLSWFPNPTESIELYGRTMDQVDCEVLPVEVEKFVSQVTTQPSAAEVKTLYEKGKYDFADPSGERPGFKVPRKANVQYLIANFDTYLENEMNKLTDEDVQKEYERLVEAEDDLVMEAIVEAGDAIEITDPPPVLPGQKDPAPAPGDGSETPSDVAPPPTTEKSDQDQPAAPPAQPADAPAKTEPASGEKSDAKTSGDETAKANPEEPKKASEKKDDASNVDNSKTDDAKKQEDGSKTQDDDQSLKINSQTYQFVSTAAQDESAQQETKKQDPPAKTESETGPEAAKTQTESKAPAADQDAKKPAETKQSTDKETSADPAPAATDSTKKPEPSADAAQQTETPATDPAAPGADQENAPEKPERKPKPLKDVVVEVKRAMSEAAAKEAMKEALTKASVLVQDHFEKMIAYEYDREIKNVDPPEPLDIEALAKTYNLEANETGMLDSQQMGEDPIGQIRVFMQTMVQGRQMPRLVPVSQLIFQQFAELKPYESETVDDSWGTGSSYLYWVAEKAESRIPSLDEARPAIEKFWKQQRAFDMAMAEAESLKTKVTADKKLSDVYPARAIQTGAFSWLSGSARFSSPIGVTSPGEEFMQTAFSLEANQVGVAPNETRSTVYVIQALVPSRSVDVVGNEYLNDQFFKFKQVPAEVKQAGQRYGQMAAFEWRDEFQDEMEFKYVNR